MPCAVCAPSFCAALLQSSVSGRRQQLLGTVRGRAPGQVWWPQSMRPCKGSRRVSLPFLLLSRPFPVSLRNSASAPQASLSATSHHGAEWPVASQCTCGSRCRTCRGEPPLWASPATCTPLSPAGPSHSAPLCHLTVSPESGPAASSPWSREARRRSADSGASLGGQGEHAQLPRWGSCLIECTQGGPWSWDQPGHLTENGGAWGRSGIRGPLGPD